MEAVLADDSALAAFTVAGIAGRHDSDGQKQAEAGETLPSVGLRPGPPVAEGLQEAAVLRFDDGLAPPVVAAGR